MQKSCSGDIARNIGIKTHVSGENPEGEENQMRSMIHQGIFVLGLTWPVFPAASFWILKSRRLL